MSQNPQSNTKRSPYANSAMPNGTERTTQPQRQIGTTFPQPSAWSGSSIWGNAPSSTVLGTRETLGSRGSPEEVAAEIADNESWRRTNWTSETTQTRTSSSTSSNRTRETVGRNNTTQPAFGQRPAPNGTSRWNTTPMVEPGPGTFLNNRPFDSDTSARVFRNERGPFHDTYNGAGTSTFPRDSGEFDSEAQGPHYEIGYDAQPAGTAQSHRGSFGSTHTNMRTSIDPANGLDNIQQRFRAGLSLSNGSAASNEGFATFNSASNRPFRFNPDSQEWESQRVQGNGTDGRFQHTHGDPSDRPFSSSSANIQSRASPGVTGGTPQLHDPMFRHGPGGLRSVPEPSHNGAQVTNINLNSVHTYMPTTPYYAPNFGTQQQPHGHYPNVNPRFGPGFQPQYSPGTNNHGLGGGPHRSARDHDASDAQRSPLLKDFRQSQKINRRWELKEIYGHIVEFAGDQHGSRFIQDKITTANSDEKEQIFSEIEPMAGSLMKDVFGNYVIQRIFEHNHQIQKKLLAGTMKGRVSSLTHNQYGCRCVQKALEHVLLDQQVELVRELEPEIVAVLKDQNGNHVIQKALQFIPPQRLDFIFNSFRGKVKELCQHTFACRVLQKAMEFGTEDDRARIVEEVLPHTTELSKDQYGNYVVQHIVKMNRREYTSRVINNILGDIVALSKQKYASNVVELCGSFGTDEDVLKMEAEWTRPGPDGIIPLKGMVTDPFANYVVQKHLKRTPNRQAFVEALRPQLQWAKVGDNYSGKHAEKIADLLRQISAEQPTGQAAPSTRNSSIAPTSPLQLDVGSVGPTPSLTMEPNSPSSNPPSTTDSAVDELVVGTLKGRTMSADGNDRDPEVRVEEES